MIKESDKQIILKKLAERIGVYKCPICHSSSFTIADGYLANTLQDNLNSIQLGGTFLPSVALVCTNCGFTSLHNTKILVLDK